MLESEALRILLDACHDALAAARAGDTWLADMVGPLEELCGRLECELDASF